MACPSGFSDLSNYPRQKPMDILPWDHDGSPCREAYMGAIEALWWEFVNGTDACESAPGQPECKKSDCVVARYAAYLTAFNNAGNTYVECKGV